MSMWYPSEEEGGRRFRQMKQHGAKKSSECMRGTSDSSVFLESTVQGVETWGMRLWMQLGSKL